MLLSLLLVWLEDNFLSKIVFNLVYSMAHSLAHFIGFYLIESR